MKLPCNAWMIVFPNGHFVSMVFEDYDEAVGILRDPISTIDKVKIIPVRITPIKRRSGRRRGET